MFRPEQADRQALLAGWRAMTGLLRARDAREATEVLVTAVRELGGTVTPATTGDPEALPLDLSLGVGEAVLPVAPVGGEPRQRMEQVLPTLIEEARVVVARAWHETLLGERAEQDWLTGLLNRRGASRLLPRLTERDVVALIDLDEFKQLNDSAGHAAGDELIAAFGLLLREHAREGDRFGRLGGDEFLGIFPGTSVDQAVQVLERLRSLWRERAPYPVAFSAGVAAAGGGASALGQADQAMYDAKGAGGDQVRVAVPTLPRPRSAERVVEPAKDELVNMVLERLERGEARAATEVAYSLLEDGAHLHDLVRDLLVPVQDEVGKRWQQGRWTVADEHLATGAVDAALTAASLRADRVVRGFRHLAAGTSPSRPVALVCPEGEWHELPARMFGTMLYEAGLDVTVFGPSLPAADLSRALAERPFSGMVLSCTTAMALPAAGDAVRAAHSYGVPVLAGGRAWGTSAKRAAALGADGWAADAEQAAAMLRGWALQSPPLRDAAPRRAPRERLTASGVERIAAELGATDAAKSDLTAGVPAVLSVLGYLDAALAVDDPSVFQDYVDWLTTTLSARGFGDHAVAVLLATVDRGLDESAQEASRLLRSAAAAATGS